MLIKFLKSQKQNLTKKFRLLAFIFIILSSIAFILILKYYNKLSSIIPNLNNANTISIINEDSLINEVKNVNKIIPLEIELSESILIDKSFSQLEIFKKTKKITFFAKCSYSIDLSQLSQSDVSLNKDEKIVVLSLPPPEIFSITITEDKTQYFEPDLGLFRFGDIELSSEEYGTLRKTMYDAFRNKMQDQNLLTQVIDNTKSSLQKIISDILDEGYIVNIKINDK